MIKKFVRRFRLFFTKKTCEKHGCGFEQHYDDTNKCFVCNKDIA
tara:strand:- start:205 stop:336 length:132 start_codon:yes stop_codon:yes gene_type:complete